MRKLDLLILIYLTLCLSCSTLETTNEETEDEEIIQPGVFENKLSLPANGRYAAISFSIGDKAYLGLGLCSNGIYAHDFWEYTPELNTWTKKADYPGNGNYAASSFVINGKGYVCLGHTAGSNASDLWEYSPNNNVWVQKADFPGTPRYGAISFTIGDKAFVGTGSYGNSHDYLNDFWMYNQTSNSWSRLNNFPGDKRSHAASFVIGDNGYVGTGLLNASTAANDMWKYDAAEDKWISVTGVPIPPRMGLISFVLGSRAYVGTGFDFIKENNDFYEYDSKDNSWSILEAANQNLTGRHSAVCFLIENTVYIATGNSGNGLLSDLWSLK